MDPDLSSKSKEWSKPLNINPTELELIKQTWPKIQGQLGLLHEIANQGIGRFKGEEAGAEYIEQHWSQVLFFLCVCDYHNENVLTQILHTIEDTRQDYVKSQSPGT